MKSTVTKKQMPLTYSEKDAEMRFNREINLIWI